MNDQNHPLIMYDLFHILKKVHNNFLTNQQIIPIISFFFLLKEEFFGGTFEVK